MEVGTIGFQVWDNEITALKSKEEEDAYLLHLKDLHGTHEEMGERMKRKWEGGRGGNKDRF